jgi:glycosyltransferase involved in cell wall biosynthesis
MYLAAKREDKLGLVTYVNYPTTEYLDLKFLDFQCFNVYLETPDLLNAYLARLQNLAGDRPLVMAELGLDSRRNGVDKQAEVLSWQVRETFANGCAGMFVFAWTDEWHRGGFDIDDWDFGLTTRDRAPKPALDSVLKAYHDTPFQLDRDWPKVSVVVCTYNGARTIAETLDALQAMLYPNYEVIVVNDGSTDSMREKLIAYESAPGFRIIHKENGGLSSARNVGMRAAAGEIVAYIDDDAYPGPYWLFYIAHHMMTTGHAAAGGPNLPPWGDGMIGEVVAHSPGGPNHVLYSDTIAEHIPGCNMAFRRDALLAINGFDERFRIAGDDVDLCWRIQRNGGVIGFHAGATVFHHRRLQLRGYLRQQQNYGRAEAMLEQKWPGKYNKLGHIVWHGRIYGTGFTMPIFLKRQRVYHGVWGSAAYQSSLPRYPSYFQSIMLMPEWYLIIGLLLLVCLPGILWKPLLFLAPLLAVAIGAPMIQAVMTAWRAELRETRGRFARLRCRALIACMHILQPMVRLKGRITGGLTIWQRTKWRWWDWPIVINRTFWSEKWESPEQRLERLETAMRVMGASCFRGQPTDRWDIEIRGGFFGHFRLRMMVEEHGGGKQLTRLRGRPVTGAHIPMILGLLVLSVIGALVMESPGLVLLFVMLTLTVTALTLGECGVAAAYFKTAVARALGKNL